MCLCMCLLVWVCVCFCLCVFVWVCIYLCVCMCIYLLHINARTKKTHCTHICKVSTALRSSIGALKTYIKISSKVTFSTIFLGHLMTSEAKDYFYKVEDNLVNYIHKKLCHYIWAGLCVKRFQSFEFKWHVLTAKIYSERSIFKILFRPFNDLLGQRSFLQSWRQSCEIYLWEFS